MSEARYRGLFPVVPTTFSEAGELDLASQKRCLDFMIDAGSDGLCILANFAEQFLLSDDEREVLTRIALEHVAGRVPVIVTTTHFSSKVCAERSLRAEAMGAAMVMVMPPYYTRWLPLINIENRQCGFLAAKTLMKEGGIIACDAPRHPWPTLHPASRAMLLEAARRLDVLALRWSR